MPWCAQANGITLTFIEKSGLLSLAESLGLLSAASDRCALSGRPSCLQWLPSPLPAQAMLCDVPVYPSLDRLSG